MIFISHATADDHFVNELVQQLDQIGFKTWVDHRDMPVGSRWVKHLEGALARSDLMILVCSVDSMNSTYVEAEWHTFFDMKKEIIPVRVDDCVMPPFLRTLHQIDFRNRALFPTRVTELLQALPEMEDTLHVAPVKNHDATQPVPAYGVEQMIDDAQKILEELAPTQVANTIQFVLPDEEMVLQYPMKHSLVVGRDHRSLDCAPDVDLKSCQNSHLVSRHHAVFHMMPPYLYVEDLASANGTYINGTRIPPHQPMQIPNYAVVSFSKQVSMVVRYQF